MYFDSPMLDKFMFVEDTIGGGSRGWERSPFHKISRTENKHRKKLDCS